jgi:hypothetical protein
MIVWCYYNLFVWWYDFWTGSYQLTTSFFFGQKLASSYIQAKLLKEILKKVIEIKKENFSGSIWKAENTNISFESVLCSFPIYSHALRECRQEYIAVEN